MLELLDLTLRLEKPEYDRQLKGLQNRVALLGYEVYRQQKPVVIVFEGADASGKGGNQQFAGV